MSPELQMKFKLYGLVGVSYILIVLTIVFLILSYLNNQKTKEKNPNADSFLESIKTENGFSGKTSKGSLSVNVEPKGLLFGSGGMIQAATSSQVLASKFVNFTPDTDSLIDPQLDSIQTALQKCITMRSTVLEGFNVQPASLVQQIQQENTIMQSLSILQTQFDANSYIFRMANRDNVQITLNMNDANMWLTPIYGSNIIPSNTLKIGDVLYFETEGHLQANTNLNNIKGHLIVSPATTTNNLLIGPLIADDYTYKACFWVHFFNSISPTRLEYTICGLSTAVDPTGNIATNNAITNSELNPTIQQTFDFKMDAAITVTFPTYSTSSVIGRFLFRAGVM